jgi:hypothetical protein
MMATSEMSLFRMGDIRRDGHLQNRKGYVKVMTNEQRIACNAVAMTERQGNVVRSDNVGSRYGGIGYAKSMIGRLTAISGPKIYRESNFVVIVEASGQVSPLFGPCA